MKLTGPTCLLCGLAVEGYSRCPDCGARLWSARRLALWSLVALDVTLVLLLVVHPGSG
ncbi:MAG TPA: hypothetical protein VHR43_07525 [Gemmatimonadales bacterium]|jgi:hypothetical protein|nr:hypothetical protein [Gemmatimonadales bacterium]